ncbi:hypothetical protein [Tychonema sp. LEGE 07203]|uniref:hypothetical protein n=1 Tax=Tychonema sp. LEGE 07203 TaxID=1828671 RepID=UPI001880C2FF|nr:hypothetical protein [Tychonema sp. LEGE 07203]MBE9097037.1 hypothetical protein [Tychonema sp. LEGE 07203]
MNKSLTQNFREPTAVETASIQAKSTRLQTQEERVIFTFLSSTRSPGVDGKYKPSFNRPVFRAQTESSRAAQFCSQRAASLA